MYRIRPVFRITLAVFILSGLVVRAVFAGGAKEEQPTVIAMADQPRQFIAPGNPEAKQRQLILPFSTMTVPGTNRVIRAWTFAVFNVNGILVYTNAKYETRDRGFLGELFNIGRKPQVEIPPELRWDGTYQVSDNANNGQLVPDGNYSYMVSIVDDAGNRAQTPPFNVTVKNTPVAIDYIRIEVPVFNPLGTRKSVHIDQSGTRETHWEGRITDNNQKIVRTILWENPTDLQVQDVRPEAFDWDGKNDAGVLLPEGNYQYSLKGLNRAGHQVSLNANIPITISTKSGGLTVAINSPVIAPNGDGVLDSLTISTQVRDLTGLQQWSLGIADVAKPDTVLWSKIGKGPVPPSFVFDGKGDAGRSLPEGKYQIVLKANYDNGNLVDSVPVPFDLVLSPPPITVSALQSVFGGSTKPQAEIKINGQSTINWTLVVSDKSGAVIYQEPLANPENYRFIFGGKDSPLSSLPDDLYTISVSGKNWAGIKGSATAHVRKDSRNMQAKLELSQPVLVPNRGKQGLVRITPVPDYFDSIEKFKISIVDQKDVTVADKSAELLIPYWDFNGKSNVGKQLADGSYTVFAAITYANGSTALASAPLKIDSTIPDIKLSLKPDSKSLTPAKNTMQYLISTVPNTGVKEWRLAIRNGGGDAEQTFSGTGPVPAAVTWDGKTNRGITVDGAYSAVLTVTYDTGLSGQAIAASPVLVSSAGPQFELALSSETFVPGNIDGPDSLDIKIKVLPAKVAVDGWKIEITDVKGSAFRSFSGKGIPPEKVTWNGKSNTGQTVDSGEDYRIAVTLTDALGIATRQEVTVPIDILVVRMPNGSLKIVVSSIQFAGYSSDIFKVQEQLLLKNMFAIRRLAGVLNKFTDYKIRLDGYAVAEFADDPKLADWEQKSQLLPLSTARAEEVMNALVLMGVDRKRFSTTGYGGSNPLIPNSDLENRWKNRRVEFYLEKK